MYHMKIFVFFADFHSQVHALEPDNIDSGNIQ